MIPLIVVIAIAFILILMLISIYNRLVRLRNNREQAFADIDVQLKQRHDLIPQLVKTVKGLGGPSTSGDDLASVTIQAFHILFTQPDKEQTLKAVNNFYDEIDRLQKITPPPRYTLKTLT